jgi:hypothetical protein
MASWFQRWIEKERERRDARQFTATGLLLRAQANLEPGVLTAEGFLGRDTRRLGAVIREDEATFRELGLDWDEVAAWLEHLVEAGAAGLGEPTTVNRWLVRVAETRGTFPCPWEDGLFRKRSVTVRRLGPEGEAEGPELLFSDLSLHLLKDHHFLQGRGSPFRLEPRVLKELL